jgi:uncharacterized membrane-anchored protein
VEAGVETGAATGVAAGRLPDDHALRAALAEELHARPPVPVDAPAVVGFLALTDAPLAEVLAAVRTLGPAPSLATGNAAHGIEGFDGFSLKWEQHGEFVTLCVVRPAGGGPTRPLDAPDPWQALPAGWLGALPGRTIAAGSLLVLRGDRAADAATLAAWFDPESLSGAEMAGGTAWAYTDFRLHGGGTRWLVIDADARPLATARHVQRVIEIDVYRMTALLGFPLARASFAQLSRIEGELERITAATAELRGAEAHDAERALLQQLTGLAAEVESLHAATAFRFGASLAYWNIVRSRLGDLHEERIPGVRTLSGFLMRRLAPAMESCAAAARRQEHLSARVERASALLRTRVDVAREEQNQRILAAMERRGKLQLRLQQTVEGLSVVAITYYAAGLIAWTLKPLDDQLPTKWIVAAAVPLLALVGLAVTRRARRRHAAD